MIAQKAQIEGLKNFAQNIKKTMLKFQKGEKLESYEAKSITEFYLEVCYFLNEMKGPRIYMFDSTLIFINETQ